MISADEGGFVEYWKPVEPFELPSNVPGLWSFKSETDLYEFKKVRILIIAPLSIPLTHTQMSVQINSNLYHALP